LLNEPSPFLNDNKQCFAFGARVQHLDFFPACDEFPGRLCLVGQVENLRAGWQPALFRLPVSEERRDIWLRLCSVGQADSLADSLPIRRPPACATLRKTTPETVKL
jgi:hypothetical protein